jgi:TPR repeat protein
MYLSYFDIALLLLIVAWIVKHAYVYGAETERGYAAALFNLGMEYRLGEAVPLNNRRAIVWFRKAAEQGHAEAQFSL